jgi:hypothetical protein
MKIAQLTSALAAGAAAAAIVTAPTASAAQSCQDSGGGTVCQSQGNVQIDDSPPGIPYDPYGDEGILLGDGGGFGGFHGGGFHGGGFGGHAGGHR